MHELATIEPNGAVAQPKSGKRLRVSPRIRRAIDALVFGEAKTQTAAAAIAGLDRSHLCRELTKPHIEAFYDQRVRQSIGRARMRAAARVSELIDASSEHVSLDASKHVLAIAGITPPDNRGPSVNINITPGYVIDLGGSAPLTIDAKPIDDA